MAYRLSSDMPGRIIPNEASTFKNSTSQSTVFTLASLGCHKLISAGDCWLITPPTAVREFPHSLYLPNYSRISKTQFSRRGFESSCGAVIAIKGTLCLIGLFKKPQPANTFLRLTRRMTRVWLAIRRERGPQRFCVAALAENLAPFQAGSRFLNGQVTPRAGV